MTTTALQAMRTTLAAEHVCVFTYAVLGARTSRTTQASLARSLSDAYSQHRAHRDALIRMIRDLGVEPDAAAPAYDLTRDLSSPTKVAAVALHLEAGAAATYADLVAATEGQDRAWAITALNDAAVRELAFGGKPESFPGLAEFADR